jgi:hypothetical protein
MITVVDYAKRQRTDGKEFIALILQGGLEMIKSKVSNQYYATVRKCSISSTFDEPTAKMMVGEKIPGSIQKLTCDPYQYVVKETGEILNLDFRWAYLPEGATMEEAIFEGEPMLHEVKKPVFLKL